MLCKNQRTYECNVEAIGSHIHANAAINLFIPVLQVCTAVIRYYLPWFQFLLGYLFVNPSPLRSPHRPYCPWLHNRPSRSNSFQHSAWTKVLTRTVSFTSCPWPHDSMTYEIACFGRLNKFNPSIGHLTFHDISGLVSNWGPLDAWHKSFPTPWFPNTNKIA